MRPCWPGSADHRSTDPPTPAAFSDYDVLLTLRGIPITAPTIQQDALEALAGVTDLTFEPGTTRAGAALNKSSTRWGARARGTQAAHPARVAARRRRHTGGSRQSRP